MKYCWLHYVYFHRYGDPIIIIFEICHFLKLQYLVKTKTKTKICANTESIHKLSWPWPRFPPQHTRKATVPSTFLSLSLTRFLITFLGSPLTEKGADKNVFSFNFSTHYFHSLLLCHAVSTFFPHPSLSIISFFFRLKYAVLFFLSPSRLPASQLPMTILF